MSATTRIDEPVTTGGRPRLLGRLLHSPVGSTAALVLAAIVLLAIFAPWLTTGQPTIGSVLRRLKPIGTPGHWLGTDETRARHVDPACLWRPPVIDLGRCAGAVSLL